MRIPALLSSCTLLAACAAPLPVPDAQMSRVEFRSEAGELLMAEMLDGQRLREGRLFQFEPGSHRLRISYRYEVLAGGDLLSGRLLMLCYLRFAEREYLPATRYLIHARHRQYEPEVWLTDASGQTLAEAEQLHCMQE